MLFRSSLENPIKLRKPARHYSQNKLLQLSQVMASRDVMDSYGKDSTHKDFVMAGSLSSLRSSTSDKASSSKFETLPNSGHAASGPAATSSSSSGSGSVCLSLPSAAKDSVPRSNTKDKSSTMTKEEKEAKMTAKKEAIGYAYKVGVDASQVDMAFLIDTTGTFY